MERVFEESGDGKATYEGGLRKCMLVKEGMSIEEMRTLVKEPIGSDLSEHKVRYSLNYDRQTLIAVEEDTDVRLKGNNEHSYLSVGDNDGPRKRVKKGVEVCKGWTHTSDDVVVCGRSKRGGAITVQEGRKGVAKQGREKRWQFLTYGAHSHTLSMYSKAYTAYSRPPAIVYHSKHNCGVVSMMMLGAVREHAKRNVVIDEVNISQTL
ncbi:hypothetical protein Cgig2_010427 [Carnegiea gigantea]|uniref:Uncharacterized protein n=1 Tax=Carnegiea gigantea TaxID=171969 RepID=A0A9Q1QBK0_9CARY|nr:hypothetical protein Cgig2_010427 [Carnegiea gigantea]